MTNKEEMLKSLYQQILIDSVQLKGQIEYEYGECVFCGENDDGGRRLLVHLPSCAVELVKQLMLLQ